MGRVFACLLALAFAPLGCANEYHPDYHPESYYSYKQEISAPMTVFQSGRDVAVSDAPSLAPSAQGDPNRVLILQSTHLDRPAQVVGVVDMHEPMGHQDAALDALRRKAAAMGADAVVGVEFHHEEGEGQPTHLSGLAVRFLRSVPYPVGK